MTKATHEVRAPRTSGTFDPTVAESRPDIGPTSSIPTVAGTMKRPACGDRGAEAEARRRRQLDELGHEDERREHPEADHEGGEVGRPHGPKAHHPHVDERRVAPRLGPDPGREDDRRDREQAERPGRQPPPRRPLADGHEERHQPSGEEHGAERIDAAPACGSATRARRRRCRRSPRGRRRAAARRASGRRGAARSGPPARSRARRRCPGWPRSGRCRAARAVAGTRRG